MTVNHDNTDFEGYEYRLKQRTRSLIPRLKQYPVKRKESFINEMTLEELETEIRKIENELKQAGNQQIPGSRKKKLNATEAFSLRTRLAGLKQEYTAKKEKTKGTK